MNAKERNRNRLYMIFFSGIILIPALGILFKTIKKVNTTQAIDSYLRATIQDEGTILSDWTLANEEQSSLIESWKQMLSGETSQDTTQLILKIIGAPLSTIDINQADLELEAKLGRPVNITTYQSEEIPLDDIKRLKNQVSGEISQKLKLLESQTDRLAQVEAEITALKESNYNQLDSLQTQKVYKKIKAMFPAIQEIAIAENVIKTDFVQETELPMVFVKWDAKKSSSQRKIDQKKLMTYIKLETPLDTLQLIAY